ncbi:MAG: DinB family protein [Planctomycetaceae bacterium]|nr:DinB family protein [Planctomycetaceae bacterium]
MQAIELVRFALEMTDGSTLNLVQDMRDKSLTQPGPNGGNHPLWIMGHLCVVEGSLRKILYCEPNPVEHWTPIFGLGSTPQTDASVYPPFDEVVKTFHELRADTLRRLEALGNEGLDRTPIEIPPGFEDAMKTFGHTLLLIALHQMVHYGQIADARRAAGLKPLR